MTTTNSSYCFDFKAQELRNNTIVTVILHFVAMIACILVIVYIYATKQHKVFTYRLILYLMIISAAWSISLMFEIIPVYHNDKDGTVDVRKGEGWQRMCEAVGYISQLFETSKMVMVCWIVLFLLLVVVFKFNASTPFCEVCGLLAVIGIPFALDWLPFAWKKYGLSGLYCWIMLTEKDCSKGHRAGIGLTIGVQFGPTLIAAIFSIVAFVMIIVTLSRTAMQSELSLVNTYQRGLRKVVTILVYPIIYLVIFVFRLIHRTVYFVEISHRQHPWYNIWLAHTITVGIGAILIPLVFMLHPQVLRKLCFNRCFSKNDERKPVLFRSASDGSNNRDSLAESNEGSSSIYKSILARSVIQSS